MESNRNKTDASIEKEKLQLSQLTIPPGYILVNRNWSNTDVARELAVKGTLSYAEGMGIVDFKLSSGCCVMCISESELIAGTSYKLKVMKFVNISSGEGVVIAYKNANTLDQFSRLQYLVVLKLNLTIIPIEKESDLSMLLSEMIHVESKPAANPFLVKSSVKPLKEQQLTLLSTIDGIGDKKARKLLERFGSIYSICFAAEHELVEVVGQAGAQNVIQFFHQEETFEMT